MSDGSADSGPAGVTDWQAAAMAPARPGQVLVGLLGQGIGLSRTPGMHMHEAAAQGLDLEYRLLDTAQTGPAPELGPLLAGLEGAGYRGLNVTYPYKQRVMPLLDELSDAARAVGAVNTVVFRDGRRYGHNTDYWGFAESLRRGLPQADLSCVLLLGAGGAGGAVANALLDQGVGRLLLRDLDGDRAAALVAGLAARFGPDRVAQVTDLAQAAAQAAGIVNASPVGMAKLPGLPIDADLIAPRHWVADIVYFPLETELLALARDRGCQVLPGAGMALFQAVRAFGLFTGREADPARMRTAFDRLAPA